MTRRLLQAWKATLRRRSESLAIAEAANDRTATFRDLDEASDAWRAEVAGQVDLRGAIVVFAEPNGIGWLEIFLGLLKSGAVIAPLDPGEPAASQRAIAERIRAARWWNGSQLVELENPRRFRHPEIGLIKLTSGTTGEPRALPFTDSQMLADGRQVTTSMGITSQDFNYGLIPFGHSYGLGSLSIPLVSSGIPVACGGAAFPHAIGADFARWKPTVFPGVPSVWRALAESEAELPGLRLAISAGAPLPVAVAETFARRFGRRLHAFYGSSETGGIAYDRAGSATLEGKVGRALRGVRLTHLPGGRLRVASAAVTTHGNRRRAGDFGSWIMADRVERDAKGNLRLVGRRGSTVKIAGRRVDLAEILRRVRGLPEVIDAWVGISGGPEPTIGAAVVSQRTVAELRTEMLKTTAPWKVPKRWRLVTALPVTPRGKVDRRAAEAAVFGSSKE